MNIKRKNKIRRFLTKDNISQNVILEFRKSVVIRETKKVNGFECFSVEKLTTDHHVSESQKFGHSKINVKKIG